MIKRIAAIMFGAMLTPGIAAERVQPHHHHHYHRPHRKKIQSVDYRKIAEAKGYKKVSSLVNFPEFFPGWCHLRHSRVSARRPVPFIRPQRQARSNDLHDSGSRY
jgi:hypothetical protein